MEITRILMGSSMTARSISRQRLPSELGTLDKLLNLERKPCFLSLPPKCTRDKDAHFGGRLMGGISSFKWSGGNLLDLNRKRQAWLRRRSMDVYVVDGVVYTSRVAALAAKLGK